MEPLKRAFAGLDAWICGLRRDQSVTRHDVQMIEWDEANKLVKINPLINWTEDFFFGPVDERVDFNQFICFVPFYHLYIVTSNTLISPKSTDPGIQSCKGPFQG